MVTLGEAVGAGLTLGVLEVDCEGADEVGFVIDALEVQALSAITTAADRPSATALVVEGRALTAGHDPSVVLRWRSNAARPCA